MTAPPTTANHSHPVNRHPWAPKTAPTRRKRRQSVAAVRSSKWTMDFHPEPANIVTWSLDDAPKGEHGARKRHRRRPTVGKVFTWEP